MDMDIGFCEKHRRPFEALCKDCEEPVCASCVMFDLHLKHDIVRLEEGNMFLRQNIKNEEQKGLLKKDFAEKHLLEIREYGLRLEKLRSDTIKLIESKFNSIISAVKKRKTVLMSEIIDYFSEEKSKIVEDEKKWLENQKMTEQIVAFAKDPNDANVLLNAKFIMDTLKEIGHNLQYKETKLFNSVDTSFKLDEVTTISYEQLLYYFGKYMEILEPNLLEFTT